MTVTRHKELKKRAQNSPVSKKRLRMLPPIPATIVGSCIVRDFSALTRWTLVHTRLLRSLQNTAVAETVTTSPLNVFVVSKSCSHFAWKLSGVLPYFVL